MDFTNEELDFFQQVFSPGAIETGCKLKKHDLTVQTSIPKSIAHILGSSKLTLLAEISHYQLWFPLSLSMDEEGEFSPKLGTPEIIDIQGIDRSWRVMSPKNVSLHNEGTKQQVEILSLSSSGIKMRVNCPVKAKKLFENKDLEIHLPNQSQVKLALEPVRTDNNVLAAKFKDVAHGRDCLRKFLFNLHRSKYSELYKNLN
ncbi:hypothetical protein [Pseudoalteromonas denitrificans]|uniref:PilZ domain-containing protein n=1 Tax=Pseudoalteromonas denitrificans DSM 6059 TaxID=1123010 RepID=A0A1I1FJY7_9GAMM|nr:hypothetical protein [Pseudoalteromonas denitrificans]SFB99302.1 hypothetical protein SAMN02745724_00657 [Pseudoalteromonas denitrificans DSM 6059]